MRKSGTTVILVTHAAHRLPFADSIIALNQNGEIAEQGSFDYLMQHGTYVASIAAKHKREDNDNLPDEPLETTVSFRNPAESEEIARAEDETSRRVGDWSTYLYYIRACGWTGTFCFLAGMVCFGLFMKLPGVYSKSQTANGSC